MATWVTHLMIADEILEKLPWLDRRGFCVGSIAPDCNMENADWTDFTPPRAVTHWMTGPRKKTADCDAFCRQYILNRPNLARASEEYAFLLGYYAHLITDAVFQGYIRDETRVKAAWDRVKSHKELAAASFGMEPTWDNIKKLIPKQQRMDWFYGMEAEYLRDHPGSGFLTEILPLETFPDYIDYLPKGGIVRKIGVMGFVPRVQEVPTDGISMSREEFFAFVEQAVCLVIAELERHGLTVDL